MQRVSRREKSLNAQGIKAQLYKHTQDVGNCQIDFRKALLFKFLKSQKNFLPKITLFHIVDSSNRMESFTYKSRGYLFVNYRNQMLPLEYLQTIRIKISPLI